MTERSADGLLGGRSVSLIGAEHRPGWGVFQQEAIGAETLQDTSNLWKPTLAIVAGGVLLGAFLGQVSSLQMKPGPEANWRERYRSHFTAESMQFVDSGPQDLTPLAWGTGIGLSAYPPEFAPGPPLAGEADYAIPEYDYPAPDYDYATPDYVDEERYTPSVPVDRAINAAISASATAALMTEAARRASADAPRSAPPAPGAF